MEAKIVNVAPDKRAGPIWELQRRSSPDLPWEKDSEGSSNGSPEALRAIAEREVCPSRVIADVRRIAEVMGPRFSLWGADAPCRQIGCPGRVRFVLRPRGAVREYVMTAKAPR